VLHGRRDTLVRALLAHGENELAGRTPSLSDEQLERIGELAEHYAVSPEHAAPQGGSIGITRAISLATLDVVEGASRELHRTEGQRDRSAEEEALRRLGAGR